MSPAVSTARAAARAAARRYAEHPTPRNRIAAETKASLAGEQLIALMPATSDTGD